MGGLREKKKAEAREKILAVSKEIFFSKGYSHTTIQEIAEKANIGVGTVYNFFKTKADILISVVAGEAGTDAEEYHLEDTELEQGIVDIVMAFTWKALGKLKYLNKKIWKELLSAMFSLQKSESKLFKGLTSMDFKYLEKLKALLQNLKERGALAAAFDVDAAAMAVYSTFLTQFLLYIYSDETTFEQLEQDIRRQVGFIFGGKCSMKG